MNRFILLSTLGYLISSLLLYARMRGLHFRFSRPAVMITAAVACVVHGLLLMGTMIDETGVHIGLGVSLSLAGWLSAMLILASSVSKPVESLGLIIFPLSLIGLLLPAWLPPPHLLSHEIGVHVLLSLIAFTLIGLAAAQAALLMVQEKRLRDRQWQGVIGTFPPLALMERMQFEWLVAGFISLSLALVTGVLFVDNLVEQHLAHKALFTVLTWLLVAVLLWGHYRLGWRGQRAAQLTLWGYGLLVVGYAGSQFVLEVVLV
jgi:ABC-type uncharacterized transport system permease subunit